MALERNVGNKLGSVLLTERDRQLDRAKNDIPGWMRQQ
jgi:hypothetical protein